MVDFIGYKETNPKNSFVNIITFAFALVTSVIEP